MLREEDAASADYFVFENSLSGYDTIRFTGDRKEAAEAESLNAVFDTDTHECGVDTPKRGQSTQATCPTSGQGCGYWNSSAAAAACSFLSG